MNKPPLKVGDVLYFVPNERRGPPREVTVESVGRKWATLKGYYSSELRIDLKEWRADGKGYSSPGRCYLNASEYEFAIMRDKLWMQFRRAVECTYGHEPEPDSVIQAAKLLGIELPKE
jgi:hypothetical protein